MDFADYAGRAVIIVVFEKEYSEYDPLKKRAEAIIQEVKKLEGIAIVFAPNTLGMSLWRIALVFISIEDKERAMESVKDAVQKEMGYILQPQNYSRIPKDFMSELTHRVEVKEQQS